MCKQHFAFLERPRNPVGIPALPQPLSVEPEGQLLLSGERIKKTDEVLHVFRLFIQNAFHFRSANKPARVGRKASENLFLAALQIDQLSIFRLSDEAKTLAGDTAGPILRERQCTAGIDVVAEPDSCRFHCAFFVRSNPSPDCHLTKAILKRNVGGGRTGAMTECIQPIITAGLPKTTVRRLSCS